MWSKLRTGRENCSFVDYGPGSEKWEEIKKIFWERLTDLLKGFKRK